MRRPSELSRVRRRQVVAALAALALPVVGRAQGTRDAGPDVLSLYGVVLKEAPVEVFVAAARAAGGVELPAPAGAPPQFDTRNAGVPALERLSVIAHEGKVVTVRFTVKGYGQDNEALRRALLAKYGVPLVVSARPLPAQGFDGHASPRGAYFWTFADGMRLVYEHPRVGDVTLSYTDEAKARSLAGGAQAPSRARPTGDLGDRL
jgi:hypothetical protein